MAELPELIPVPRTLLLPSQSLKCDLFIYIVQTDNIIHFRRKGDVFSNDDLESLAKIPPDHLLIPKDQLDGLSEDASTEIEIKKPPRLVAPRGPECVTAEFLQSLISEATALAEKMLKSSSGFRSPATYVQALVEGNDEDLLLGHLRKVCGLSVLILLSTRSDAYQDAIDIAVASMVHDLGLLWAPEALMKKHLLGDLELSAAEKTAHTKHIDDTLKIFVDHKTSVNPTVTRIIQHHHENWDGSGLKGLRLSQIYRPARILRIADELVSILSQPNQGRSLPMIIRELSTRVGESKDPVFDPSILVAIMEDFGEVLA